MLGAAKQRHAAYHVPDGVRRRSGPTDLQTQLATTRKFYDACMKPAARARARVEEANPGRAVGARRAGRGRGAWKALTPEMVAARLGTETRNLPRGALGSKLMRFKAMPFLSVRGGY